MSRNCIYPPKPFYAIWELRPRGIHLISSESPSSPLLSTFSPSLGDNADISLNMGSIGITRFRYCLLCHTFWNDRESSIPMFHHGRANYIHTIN